MNLESNSKNAARLAKPEDASVVGSLVVADMTARIEQVAPEDAAELVPHLDAQRLTESWLEAITSRDGETVLVATEDNQVVGFAAYMKVSGDGSADHVERAEILTFTIAQGHRRQGHGSRLLQALVDHAKVDTDELGIWLATADEQRVRFFSSAGFGSTPARRALNLGRVQDPENLWVSAIREYEQPDYSENKPEKAGLKIVSGKESAGCGCKNKNGCCQG